MDCCLVINLIPCDSFLNLPIEGKNSLEWLLFSIEKYAGDLPLLFLDSKKNPHDLNIFCEKYPQSEVVFCDESSLAILEALKRIRNSYFIWLDGDAPFLDIRGSLELLEQHRRYGVQLTNCDGFPLGILPEIISTEILPALLAMVETGKTFAHLEAGDSFFELLSPEVNQFDIETHLPPKDFNLLRLSCKARTKRNFFFCEKIAKALHAKGNVLPFSPLADELLTLLDENPLLYRTLPAYYSLQITNQNSIKNPIYPWKSLHSALHIEKAGDPILFIDEKQMEKLAQEVALFSDDGVFCFNHWGESALHPQIERLIDIILANPHFQLLIETSGIGWDERLLCRLAEKYQSRLIWIVELSFHQKSIYDKEMGEGFYEEAWKNAHLLSELFPQNCYCQAFRVKEYEEDLVEFWKYWKEKGQPLVQKFDHFCGKLPDRRVVDLSPTRRFPCWHIKRDLSIWCNGAVSLCKEDIDLSRSLGNLFQESMESLFLKMGETYEKHCNGLYDQGCENCDEFYTFNF